MTLLLAAALAATCQADAAEPPAQAAETVVPEPAASTPAGGCDGVQAAWRRIATQADRERLRAWREVWLDALAKAKAAGGAEAIARDDALYDPDRALDDPIPPAGGYRCRIVKLGALHRENRAFVTLPDASCTVGRDGDEMWFAVNDGKQRPIGRFFAGPPGRGVFLGTLELGDERRPLEYGLDARRNMIAWVDRIGEARWRLMVPKPNFDALAELVEITPAK